MLDELLDKDRAVALAERTSTKVRTFDPRVWLGGLLLARSAAAERRTMDGPLTPQDRCSYIPRDAAMSLLQAFHEQRVATGIAFAEGVGDRGFDYHWAVEFLTELTRHCVQRVLFRLPRAAPRVTPLAADARIVLVGDWGTGAGPAQAVAAVMAEEIAAAGQREVHVVHLGDVYYAGTAWEAQQRFLAHWPVGLGAGPQVHSWCLNGNHDMYAAGEGLFTVILTDPRFAGQRTERDEPTSEFHLRNDDWDIAGLDTSYRFRLRDVRGTYGFLDARRRPWLADRLDAPGRRSMLLSHHQPFTRSRPGADGIDETGNLLSATTGLRTGRGIDAWFWGHEHRLLTYGARSGIRYATCTGHGAVLSAPPGPDVTGPGEAEFRDTFTDDRGETWRMPGFTVVDLDGPRATVRYLSMTGRPWRAPDRLEPRGDGPR